MNGRSSGTLVLALVTLGVLIPLAFLLPRPAEPGDDPWAAVPARLPTTDHRALLPGPFADGPSVTEACLECHPQSAHEVMQTKHWTWESDPIEVSGHEGTYRLGKKNVINNFCIGVQSNWPGCTSCHAGYGWKDASFDFSQASRVDCLACHDRSGNYVKSKAGLPAEGVDLAEAAQSVGGPTRNTCGGCHFKGGGGDAVKHGDLDTSLLNPPERVDVHMGRHDLICTDCHRTEAHQMAGRSISVSIGGDNRVSCTDCHSAAPHDEPRLDQHVSAVACQTCHIPHVALREATKVHWDWAQAGQDREEDPHAYLKKKGAFVLEEGLAPEYFWFDGTAQRYLLGDPIASEGPTVLNLPNGGIDSTGARIWPFKVHRAQQPYDTIHRTLLVPKTVGPGGYWETFDWSSALSAGAEANGLQFSGSYGFTKTEMFWPLTHMVAPKENALQCTDCHSGDGRTGVLDWAALGYPGDPMDWGSRVRQTVQELESTSSKSAVWKTGVTP